MKRTLALGLSMLAGYLLGAISVSGLQAHKRPPSAYALIEVGDITDPTGLEANFQKMRAVSETFGGQTIAEARNIIGRDMVPPTRLAVIAFDSMEDAEAWSRSAAQGELDRAREKSAKGRSFMVDGRP